jgi:putative Holliday junction resolvase
VEPVAGRVLGIDLGAARIGLALSDPQGRIALPIAALKRSGERRDIDELVRLVREHEVATAVVGLPLLLSGGEGSAAIEARRFAARLAGRVEPVPVALWDERLTTVEAERALVAADVGRRRRRQAVDSMAAALILQGYLDSRSPSLGPPA